MLIPEDYELLSLFECEPKMLDDNNNIPFYYNEATYNFSSCKEKFHIVLSPACNEFYLSVSDLDTNKQILSLTLNRVDKLEILSDKKDHSKIGLTVQHQDYIQFIEIEFKPRFTFNLKEEELK